MCECWGGVVEVFVGVGEVCECLGVVVGDVVGFEVEERDVSEGVEVIDWVY